MTCLGRGYTLPGKKLTVSNSVGAEVGVSVVVWASTECSDLVAFTHTVLSRSIRH